VIRALAIVACLTFAACVLASASAAIDTAIATEGCK
jgi:hypothetical protein